eukprot:COSAG02_NODE_1173_length_14105_cov_15.197701_11_plen_74_part_00
MTGCAAELQKCWINSKCQPIRLDDKRSIPQCLHASISVTAYVCTPVSEHVRRNIPRLVLSALICHTVPATVDI